MRLVFHWAKAPQSWDRSITKHIGFRGARCRVDRRIAHRLRVGGLERAVGPTARRPDQPRLRSCSRNRSASRRGAAGAGATAARRHTAGGSSTRTGLTPAATSGSPLRALGLGARLQSQRWWRQHAGGSVIAGKKLVDRLSTKAEVQGGKSVTSSAEPPPTSWPLGWSTPSQEPSRRELVLVSVPCTPPGAR